MRRLDLAAFSLLVAAASCIPGAPTSTKDAVDLTILGGSWSMVKANDSTLPSSVKLSYISGVVVSGALQIDGRNGEYWLTYIIRDSLGNETFTMQGILEGNSYSEIHLDDGYGKPRFTAELHADTLVIPSMFEIKAHFLNRGPFQHPGSVIGPAAPHTIAR